MRDPIHNKAIWSQPISFAVKRKAERSWRQQRVQFTPSAGSRWSMFNGQLTAGHQGGEQAC